MGEPFDDLLQSYMGKEIDITVVHHVEGVKRTTTGILKEVTPDYLKLILEYKPHRWSLRYKKATYILNRKSCSFLSIVVDEV